LQVFNEQINDLLDPSQRNLQVLSLHKEAALKSAIVLLYADNLFISIPLDKRNDWQWYPC
jgi:hypothetical protein